MIRTATYKDIPALRKLFSLCFTDPESWVELYFNFRVRMRYHIVYELDGAIVSMAALYPCRIFLDGKYYPLLYLYAGATHPDHRGHGYYSELLDEAMKRSVAGGGVGVALMPGETSLYAYYAAQGYRSVFRVDERELPPPPPGDMYSLSPAGAGEILSLRDARFHGPGYVAWNEENIDFTLRCARYGGGNGWLLCKDGVAVGYALCFAGVTADEIKVVELAAPDETAALRSIHMQYGSCRYLLRQPPGASPEFRRYGCARFAQGFEPDMRTAYFNLAMAD